MLVLGAVLLVVVAVVSVVALVTGNDAAVLNLVGASLHTSLRWVFAAGALSMLILLASLALLSMGLRRERGRRQEVKRLKAAAGAKGSSRPSPPESADRGSTATRPASEPPPSSDGPRADGVEDHFRSTPRE